MAEEFPKKITDFVKEHHVITVATDNNGQPWCFNAFYAFDENNQSFIITSHDDTRHIQEVLTNKRIAGSIVLETEIVGKVQGLQFSGEMSLCENDDEKRAKKVYNKRFPLTTLAPKILWEIKIFEAKYTDNTLGFGKKLLWSKNS
ncbi:MAG: pyridoxamine 5'-phosphate oxidase family protein [Bacteroidales bacterium]|nr:pyridoxamine 5'-phosphate oxidase family protein [Bacteroidales bacterium]